MVIWYCLITAAAAASCVVLLELLELLVLLSLLPVLGMHGVPVLLIGAQRRLRIGNVAALNGGCEIAEIGLQPGIARIGRRGAVLLRIELLHIGLIGGQRRLGTLDVTRLNRTSKGLEICPPLLEKALHGRSAQAHGRDRHTGVIPLLGTMGCVLVSTVSAPRACRAGPAAAAGCRRTMPSVNVRP
jgi:hypothetical protein